MLFLNEVLRWMDVFFTGFFGFLPIKVEITVLGLVCVFKLVFFNVCSQSRAEEFID